MLLLLMMMVEVVVVMIMLLLRSGYGWISRPVRMLIRRYIRIGRLQGSLRSSILVTGNNFLSAAFFCFSLTL
jgi:hypothetical protein